MYERAFLRRSCISIKSKHWNSQKLIKWNIFCENEIIIVKVSRNKKNNQKWSYNVFQQDKEKFNK